MMKRILIATLLTLTLALSVNAQFIFVIKTKNQKKVQGGIFDKSNSLQVATFSLESDREGIVYRVNQAPLFLKVDTAYTAGQIIEYTFEIEITNTNYELDSVLWNSSQVGHFSRGGNRTIIGMSLDQEAKFVHTNPDYAEFQWSINGGISSVSATKLNGATMEANTLLQTGSYIRQPSEGGIWGLLTGSAPIQKFTYGEVGGIQDAALESFEISVNFIQTKVSEP